MSDTEATTADRLAEAKQLADAAGMKPDSVVRYLVAEVERLRAELETATRQLALCKSAVLKYAENEALLPWLIAEVERLRARNEALERLLSCYRTGKQPSESLHRELERTRNALRRAAVVEKPAALIEQTLQHHLPVVFDDYQVLCLCGETFEGPVYQRRHVASLIAAGLMCEPGCTHPAHSPEVALLRAVVEAGTGEEPKV